MHMYMLHARTWRYAHAFAHAQVESELREAQDELAETQASLRRSTAACTEAETDCRKLRIFTALHKASREAAQRQMAQVRAPAL